MRYNKFAAELLGAFALTLSVWLSVAYAMPFATPVIAAATLGLFVYTVGPISGAHLNPAVTIGMLSIGKIKLNDALGYIVCQLAGATLAMTLGRMLSAEIVSVGGQMTLRAGIGEAIGTFILAFGVASVTLQRIPAAATGLTVGGSLLVGIYFAFQFSNAILNPAVALGINAFGPMEILGPVIGAMGGAWARYALDGNGRAARD